MLVPLLATASLAACSSDDDTATRELPLCAREQFAGQRPAQTKPAGNPPETICGLVKTPDGWTIGGEGPIFDAQRTLVAIDHGLRGRTFRAQCELRSRSERAEGQWVWARVSGVPGLYCKVPGGNA